MVIINSTLIILFFFIRTKQPKQASNSNDYHSRKSVAVDQMIRNSV